MVKPILFNTEIVKAILDGRKTVTRRVIKEKLPKDPQWGYTCFTPQGKISCRGIFADRYGEAFYKLPYQPGDILYVRETWAKGTDIWDCQRTSPRYFYKANYSDAVKEFGRKVKWRPSIHMPKEAARIWLRVTDVRVERLRDITTEECIKEGFEGVRCDHAALGFSGCTDCMNTGWLEPPQVGFMYAWDSTIKKKDLDKYGWDANPWVWVIEFERCEKSKEACL